MKSALLTISLAALAFSSSSQAAWQRLGGLEKRPIDGASTSLPGTKVASSKGIGQPENIIADDVALSSKVNTGASELTIGLGRQVMVELVTFVNEGAEGRVSVEASIDNKKWASLSQSVFTAADRAITTRFAGASANYVRLQFDLSKAGAVKTLGVYGSDNDQDFPVEDSGDGNPANQMNVAAGLGGGRVIYINPSPTHGDETASKYGRFEFPESPDKFRTVIYDFGRSRTLTEIGSVHSPRPVRFSAYAFEKDLPEKEDWRGRKSFDPVVFGDMKPVALVDDSRGVGYIKTKLNKSVRARYVALRWEPDFNPPGFSVSFVAMMASGLTLKNNPNGGGNNNGPNTASNDIKDGDPQGQFNGTPFSNPFSYGSGGYGNPGRGRNPDPGTPRGPNEQDASQ